MKQITIALKNSLGDIDVMKQAIESFGQEADLPQELVHEVKFALEEVVSNTIGHGFEPGSEQSLTIRLRLGAGKLEIEVRDDGQPFNPLERPDPDLQQPFEERHIGGLGIFLLKHMLSDSLTYRREKGLNILTIEKSLTTRNSPTP